MKKRVLPARCNFLEKILGLVIISELMRKLSMHLTN